MNGAPPPRPLVVAGCAHYDDAELERLPKVTADLDTVAEVFRKLGYQPQDPFIDLTADGLRRGLAAWASSADRTEDVLVIYYAGHGECHEERHYLICRDSEISQPRATAVESKQLVEVLVDNGFRHLLLILDTCYAGLGGRDASSVVIGALGSPAFRGRWPASFAYIASTRSQDLAMDGAFAAALTKAIDDPLLGGPRQPKLLLEAVVDRINALLEQDGLQKAVSGTPAHESGPPFFPNPRYIPDIPAGISLNEQRSWISQAQKRRRAERRQHFDPRGRGEDAASGTVSHFTGRTGAMNELTAWLDDRSADLGRCLLVTGGPGVGKSSLIGRLVLLADPEARPDLDDLNGEVTLPTGRVHAAIHARHQRLDDLVAGVAQAAGMANTGQQELLDSLAERREPLTVIVDALDEAGAAGSDEEPLRIVRIFLRALAALPCVRLLVGARPHLATALGPGFSRLDLDEPRWLGSGDIAAYMRKLLLAPSGPDRATPYTAETAEPVAAFVAERVAGNYLCARLIARTLARDDRALDLDREWDRCLMPSVSIGKADSAEEQERAVGEVFKWALRTRDRYERQWISEGVLKALAYAQGSGLPSNAVWRAIARAVLSISVTDDDIRWVLESYGEFIVENTDAGERSAYRLYHESFAESLRSDSLALGRDIARELIKLVPTDATTGLHDWQAADPYLTAHLATHAAVSAAFFGELYPLVLDPQFLLTAEPIALASALPAGNPAFTMAARARAAYLRCAPALASEPDEEHRIAHLHMAALQEGADDLVANIKERYSNLPWELLWSRLTPATHRALGEFEAPVTDIAVVPLDGDRFRLPKDRRTAIVTLEATGRLLVWDYDTGQHLAELPTWGKLLTITSCPWGAPPWLILVSAGEEHEVGVRGVSVVDVSTGLPLGPRLVTKAASVHAVAACSWNDICVVAVGEERHVTLFDARTGSILARIGDLPVSYRTGSCRLALERDGEELTLGAAMEADQTDTASLFGAGAHVLAWTINPDDDWTVTDRPSYRSRGETVQVVAVRSGQVHVATARRRAWQRDQIDFIKYRPRPPARKSAGFQWPWSVAAKEARRSAEEESTRPRRRLPPEVIEWCSGRSYDQQQLSLVEGRMCCLRTRNGVLYVTEKASTTAALPTGGAITACTAGPAGTPTPELVTAGEGAHLRIWNASPHPVKEWKTPARVAAVDALYAQDVPASAREAWSSRIGTRQILVSKAWSDKFYDPYTGTPLWHPGVSGSWFASSSDPTLPSVVYLGPSRFGRKATFEIFTDELPIVATLDGLRNSRLRDLHVTSLDGQPLLLGHHEDALSLWDLHGRRIAMWRLGRLHLDRLCAVESDGTLWISFLHDEDLRIIRYPHDDAPHPWTLDLEVDRIHVFDIGLWQGAPALAHADVGNTVTVRSFSRQERIWQSDPLPARGTHLIKYAGAGVRDVLAAATPDERLLFFTPEQPQPRAHIQMGAAIWSVAPVDGNLVVVSTASGLLGLHLAE